MILRNRNVLGYHLLLDVASKVIVLHRQRHYTLRRHHLSVGSRVLSAIRFRRKGKFFSLIDCALYDSLIALKLKDI